MRTNISISKHSQQTGGVLMIVLLVTGIIGFSLASYLTLVGSQHRSTVRSQTWNAAIPVLEAGIEEALAHLNLNNVSNILRDGWQNTALNTYSLRRDLGDSFYVVDIDTTVRSEPIIYSRGYAPAPLSFASLPSTIAQAGTIQVPPGQAKKYVTRKVKVTTKLDALMTKAMVAKGQIDLSGNNISTDSFDSADPNYSRNGQYDSTKHKDKGDIATTSGLINSLSLGNANIDGKISTGPGGSFSVGSGGNVGDTRFQTDSAYRSANDLNNDHIQDGWSSDDMNVNFADVTVPFTGGYFTPSGGTITQQVVSVTQVTNTSPTYPSGATSGVLTNTTSTTASVYPSAGTFLGGVSTNYGSVTTAAYPATSTFRLPITTNTTPTTSTIYPAVYVGTVTTNTVSTTSDVAPLAGTYLGSVTTKVTGTKITYTFNKISGYTYRTLTGYTYTDVTGYTFNRVASYSTVGSTSTTNTVAVYYDYILGDGNYKLPSLSGKVFVAGKAILYVTGDVNIGSGGEIRIAPVNAGLSLYVGGANASVGGNGVVNPSGNANNFYYLGLPTNTSLSLAGNAAFSGVIYAPEADLKLSGSGNSEIDFVGASVTKTVTMNGHFHFHYDENLARIGPSKGYIVTSWNEI